jgi:hypothetical protein
VQNLLFSFKGEFEYFDLTAVDNIESVSLIPFLEDQFSPGEFQGLGNGLDFSQLGRRQT